MENKHLIFKIFCLIILVIVGLLLYGKYINTKGLIVKEIAIYDKEINKEYNGFKIVQFSDILYGSTITEEDLKKIVKEINELRADVVIFTGDLSSNKKISTKEQNIFRDNFNNIEAKLFKFACIGDNDNYYLDTYKEILENSDFILLDNSNQLVYYNNSIPINFIGITNTLDIDNLYTDYFDITLIHKPDDIKKIRYKTLIFAGHSLGGQIIIPYMGGIIKKDGAKTYLYNNYQVNNKKLYISSGLGTEKYKIRLFNKPSITLYRLYSQ